MRRGWKLVACYLLAAALLGGYTALRQPSQQPQVAPAPTAAPAYEMLYERDVTAFETLTVTLPTETYTVRSSMAYDENGRLLGVYNSLGQPVTVEGQEDFALDPTAFQMMLLCAQHLPYVARYEALDPDACGLISPSAHITVTYAQGEQLELTLGALTASGASCYVRIQGDEAIYLVPADFYAVMTRPLIQQHKLPGALTQDVSTAAQAAIVRDGETIIATRQSSAIMQWHIDKPFSRDANTAQVETLISGIAALHADAYVTTVQDAAELTSYGLDEPIRLLASFTDGTIRDIQLGADAGEGMVYARMDATGDIYLLSRRQLSFLDSATLDNLLDRFVLLVSGNTVSEISIRTPQHETLITCDWDDPDAALANRYHIGAREIPLETFASLYAGLISLQFDQSAPKETAIGDEIAVITYHLLDGSVSSVVYFDYDRYYALAQVDGEGRYLVRKERVIQAINAIQEESEHETR